MLNNQPQIHLKLLQKRAIQKTGDTTNDLICNEIVNKIRKDSKNLAKNTLETVQCEKGFLLLNKQKKPF